MYLRILCKIHVSGSVYKSMSSESCLSIFESQDPLSIHLYLRILCKIHVSGVSVSASSYLRILYKIHVFGFMSQHPLIWILYKIHVFGLISQHLCISGSSARSMSPDPYISIHMYLRILCKIHVSDSCLSIHMYLRILCKIHVSGSVYKSMSSDSCLSILESQDPLQDPCVRFMS